MAKFLVSKIKELYGSIPLGVKVDNAVQKLSFSLSLSSNQLEFVFLFNVPVINFSVILGWSNRFLGIYSTLGTLKCLAQGHYRVVVGFGA